MSYNDDLKAALVAKGYDEALNQALYNMYRAGGYTGALNDMAEEARITLGSSEMFPILP